MSNTLFLVEIPNPFKPLEQNRSQLEFRPGASVADLFPLVATNEVEIGLNGMLVPVENRAWTFVAPGDYLIVCPVLAGGGGNSKTVLRIAAMIALSIAAPYAASGLYGAFGGTLAMASATSSIAMIQTGVMIAGGLMINALIPPPKSSGKSTEADSPTYGIDGAKNTAAEGIITPICYGTFRMGGNIINNYVVNDGDTQWLYMLINAGEGPVESISDIQINNLPIDTFDVVSTPYKDVEYQTQLGSAEQLPLPWFEQTITPQNVNHRLTTDWRLVTTTGEVDRLRIDVSFASGLFRAMGDGSLRKVTVTIQVEYRVPGGTWALLPLEQQVTAYTETSTYFPVTTLNDAGVVISSTPYVLTGSEYRTGNSWYVSELVDTGEATESVPRLVGTVTSVAHYVSGTMVVENVSRTALRKSMLSKTLPESVYELRIRRTNAEVGLTDTEYMDACYVTDVNEIVLEKVAYRHTATVGLKIRLGDQLNGIPEVTYLNHGKRIRVWNSITKVWDFRASSNPAWVTFDMLSNKRYGGGAPLSRFDLDAWKDWGRYCDLKKLEFNGVFDTPSNVWDSVQVVMRCGHASIVKSGTRYTVAIERASDPVMMFSVANMVQGSFEESWTSLAERANELEGTFNDKANNYKPSSIRVYDAAAIAAGYPARTSQVDLRGVTSAQQAWDDLNIMLNINRYIQRSIKFSATMESLGCTVGSVVTVQHDMPAWGVGGRVMAGCSSSVANLDREVTLEFGKTYKLLIHHSTLMQLSGTTGAVVNAGDVCSVLLSGYDGVKVPDRLIANGKDVRVFGSFASGPSFGVTCDLISGLTSGMAYQLWNTDVIETRNVVNPTVGPDLVTDVVQVATTFSAIPVEYTNFMFGETLKVAKPFRIKSISGSHEYHRDISCIEYNATVYDPAGAVPTPNYSSLSLSVDHVTIDGAHERLFHHGLSYKSQVTITYSSTQQTYQTSNVYLSRDGSKFTRVGRDIYTVTVDATQGEQLIFKVVAMDVLGRSAPESTAPTLTYNVQGKTTAPGALQSLAYAFVDSGIEFTFQAPPEQDWLRSQGSTTIGFDLGTVFFDAKVTKFIWPFQLSAVYPVWFRSLIQGNLTSTPVTATVTVLDPATPTITSTAVLGGVVMVTWADAKTSQPIRNYEIRRGLTADTWATADVVAKPTRNSSAFSVVLEEVGDQRIFVRAFDMAGNQSAVAYADVLTTSLAVNGVRLTSTSQVIRVGLDGSFDPASVVLTANLGGSLIGLTASFLSVPPGVLTGTGNTRTLAASSFGDATTVQVTASVTVGGDTFSDSMTIAKLQAGSSAVSVILTNEAHTIPATADGIVTSWSGADTNALVFEGDIETTSDWSFTKVDHGVCSDVVDNHITVHAWGTCPIDPVLMIHANETAGSTAPVDSSPSARPIVNTGTDVVVSASNAKFGRALSFPGTGNNMLKIDDLADFDFAGNNFSIQFQLYVPALPVGGRAYVMGIWNPTEDPADHAWRVMIGTDGKVNFDYSTIEDGLDHTVVGPPIVVGLVSQVGIKRVNDTLSITVIATSPFFTAFASAESTAIGSIVTQSRLRASAAARTNVVASLNTGIPLTASVQCRCAVLANLSVPSLLLANLMTVESSAIATLSDLAASAGAESSVTATLTDLP